MKNFISLILLIVFVSQEMSSQITSIKPPSNNPSQQIEYYDSLQNFLGEKCRQYIGQEFYVIPKDEALWKYGYSDFKVNSDEIGLSYSQKQKNNYKSTKDGYSTEYDALQGKYFYVEDVVPSGDSYIAYYIKLRNKENDEVVYFAYSSTVNSWVNFPFLVVGYFEKQKELFINQQVIIKDFPKIEGTNQRKNIDLNSGNEVIINPEEYLLCTDIALDESYSYSVSLVLKNTLEEVFLFPLFTRHYGIKRIFLKDEVEDLKSKYGDENWVLIVNQKIKVGIPEEVARLSWGEPDEINHSNSGDQWVYNGQYLYFENGKLTAWN